MGKFNDAHSETGNGHSSNCHTPAKTRKILYQMMVVESSQNRHDLEVVTAKEGKKNVYGDLQIVMIPQIIFLLMRIKSYARLLMYKQGLVCTRENLLLVLYHLMAVAVHSNLFKVLL